MPRKIIPPTPEEDAAITAAANADPDARPLTSTDWERVKRDAAQDAPMPFDAESEPYDPNNPAEVATYWGSATIKRGNDQAATPGPEPDEKPAA
jgi:hypothetical protein